MLGVSEVTGFVNSRFSDPNDDHPDLQIFFGGFLANCARTGQVGERVDNNSRSIQIIPTVLHPKSRGVLKLRNKHPLSHPLIYANYLTHPDDVKVLLDGIKIALKLANTTGKTGIPSALNFDLKELLRLCDLFCRFAYDPSFDIALHFTNIKGNSET